MKYLWMEVTLDALELPIIVADSSMELARMANVEPRSIYKALSRYQRRNEKMQISESAGGRRFSCSISETKPRKEEIYDCKSHCR